ncbi:transglutaminase [Clostridium sp. P21]|uniref:Transglutaminase n=1 Tax=Clostridium muellerianum TaxID=2716538 RepID=A0A7Y0HPN6_9CLOT|nr:transglutaminase domain-containing protein [Clostridium muellerianum]NMM63196.1 transglutaminase [Clostridium muellerianum]
MKKNSTLLFRMLIILLFMFIPNFVQAAEVKNITENYDYSIKVNDINKNYYSDNIIRENKNLLNASVQQSAKQEVKGPSLLANNSCSTIEQVKQIAKDNYFNRNTKFSIHYTGNFSDLKGILNEVLDYVDTADDYVANSIVSSEVRYHGYNQDVDIDFTVQYLLTLDQENWVDEKVDSILKSIIRDSMTEDQKEKAIHDYIVKNTAYDETLAKHSAYDALHDGTTVCQGYALLVYKMLNKSGIQSRIVVGKVDGSSVDNHAWNLVNLNGKWYQLDCTWDDPVPDIPKRVSYDYYNLTDDELAKDHDWKRERYPGAYTKYDISTTNVPVKAVELDKHQITLKLGETVSLTASAVPSNASNNLINWKCDTQDIISFDGKNIKALKSGKVYITAVSDDGNFKDTCTVIVTNEISDQVDISNSMQLQEKTSVDKNKLWKLKFNKNIASSTATKNNIYILDELNNKIDVNVSFDISKDTIIVKPLESYKSGKSYYLIINEMVVSESGKRLFKPVVMKFTIK